jgi:Phage tail tube protein, GTA-gp10
MSNAITLQFADGEYTFKLGMRQICELQEKCKAGIGEIVGRCLAGFYDAGLYDINEAKFKVEDIVETIRLGLIGGNSGVVNEVDIKVPPHTAKALVDRYVLEQPLQDGWNIAAAILLASIQGYEPPKKKADLAESQKPLFGDELLQSGPV